MPAPQPDWDPLASPALHDPLGAQAELRARCPVAWTDRTGGFWAVTKDDDIAAVVRDSETFVDGGGAVGQGATAARGRPAAPHAVPPPPAALLPPLADRSARAQRARHRRRDARAVARRGRRRRRTGADVPAAGARARRVPCTCRRTRGRFSSGWSEELFENEEGRGDDATRVQEASRRLYEYSAKIVAERKVSPLDPAEDPVTGLLRRRA